MKKVLKSILSSVLALAVFLTAVSLSRVPSEAKAISQRDAIVEIALAQEGVSGCPNKYTYAYGEIGGTYNWGWCAAFVYWCAQQVGIPHSIIKRNAAAEVNSFKTPYKEYTPYADVQKGDILYMLNNNARHIGLVTDVDDEFIYTIEGNVANTVTRYQYSRADGFSDWSGDRSWQKITHYGTPAYEDIKEEPVKVLYPADGVYKITSSYREEGREDFDFVNFSKDDNNIHVRTNLDGLRDSTRVRCQYFRFTHISDGWYTITNIGTGNAMEVKDGGSAPGTNIQHGPLTKSDSQLFRFYDAGDGLCYIKSKLGCFVDIQSEDYTVNDNVWTYRFNGSPTQKWALHSHTHSYSSEITKTASCTEKGIVTYTCSGCRLIYSDELPLTEHKAVDGICTVCKKAVGEKIRYGDVNDDGKISASDARIVLRASVGLERLNEIQTEKADVAKDGRITASDARLILRASVNLEDPEKWG